MRGDPALAQLEGEVLGVKALVGTERDLTSGRQAIDHGQRRQPFGMAGSAGELGIDEQAVAVLHQPSDGG